MRRCGPQVTVTCLPPLPCNPSARELELEDRQSRLQQELRERMAVEGERGAEVRCMRGAGVGLLLLAPWT